MNSSNLASPQLVEANRAWPRPYLSWSQYDCWVRSGASHFEYFRRYLYNEPLPTTPAMTLGSRMATMLEHRDVPTGDSHLEHYRQFLPRYEQREETIQATYGDVPLLAKPDGFTVRLGTGENSDRAVLVELGEFKTGKSWTQDRADKHMQIDLYMLVLGAKYILPPHCIRSVIHWIPTYGDIESGQILPTGEIVNFEAARSEDQLIVSGAKFLRAWHEIGDAYAAECRSLGIL